MATKYAKARASKLRTAAAVEELKKNAAIKKKEDFKPIKENGNPKF